MTSAQKIKNAIWKATGIGYIMDSVYGYSLINGDNLTQGEADARFVEGSFTTAFNILPAAVSKACGAGLLEATILSMKEIEFNALLQTGGRQIDYDAYIKRLQTIDMEYENIRINTTDISKIAQNTGMPEWKISRIKEHVFSKEHILDSGVKRFDADPEIADAWYRLTNGTFNQNDIDLLNHEYFESKFESFYKTDYRTAHNKTEESGRIWDPYKEDN